MRGIRCTAIEGIALAAKVDASHGYPRCERLAGNVTLVGGGRHVEACPCTVVALPDGRCELASRTTMPVVTLRDLSLVYPVVDGKESALSSGERARIVDISDAETAPMAAVTIEAREDGKS